MSATTTASPKEVDTKLAATWREIYKAESDLATTHLSLLHLAGATFYYRGRRRVTDMTVAEAVEILEPIVEANKDDEYGYRLCLPSPGSSLGSARSSLADLDEVNARLDELQAQADEQEALYTGWSRFFLVTSSAGHVHSSMHCSTCRPTTQYGWLPELSGKDEAAAVDELGPTLCTVCFPSAPVEWTEGKKLTAAQASKRAAS